MTPNPLTHHEILALIEPFTGHGRHVDLAASDRRAWRLVFTPIEHPPRPSLHGKLIDSLLLEQPSPDSYRLTRTLANESGLTATLWAEGPDPGALLELIQSIAPPRQFSLSGAVPIARSYRFGPAPADAPAMTATSRLILTDAVSRIGPVLLALDAQTPRDRQARIGIRGADGEPLLLPEDFLAILGGAWGPVKPDDQGWGATLRVRAREPERTPDIEGKMARTVAHLATTLAQSPTGFHMNHYRERWRVVWRRILVISAELGVLAAGPALNLLNPAEESLLFMLSYFWPTLLLMALPLFAERLVFRPPVRPRPLPANAWRPVEVGSTDS